MYVIDILILKTPICDSTTILSQSILVHKIGTSILSFVYVTCVTSFSIKGCINSCFLIIIESLISDKLNLASLLIGILLFASGKAIMSSLHVIGLISKVQDASTNFMPPPFYNLFNL